MKKLLLVFVIGMFSMNMMNAQELWFDAGIKGSWGPTFLLNENLVNDANYSQQISNGYSFGGKFGFNFGYIHGITLDAMYSQNKQFYNIKEGFSDVEDLTVDWKSIDLYVLYRLYRTINYFEVGPKFSLMNIVRNNNIETTQFYVENYPSAVIGFGWYVFGKEAFTATAGIRVEYALTDVISADGKAAGYPANPVRVTAFDPYETTNPLSAQLVFEINWGIGYFAKTACAGRKHFFSF
jgi:hypothetical protein